MINIMKIDVKKLILIMSRIGNRNWIRGHAGYELWQPPQSQRTIQGFLLRIGRMPILPENLWQLCRPAEVTIIGSKLRGNTRKGATLCRTQNRCQNSLGTTRCVSTTTRAPPSLVCFDLGGSRIARNTRRV